MSSDWRRDRVQRLLLGEEDRAFGCAGGGAVHGSGIG